MQVQRLAPVGKSYHTYWIQAAGDGLYKIALAGDVSAFYRAEAVALFKEGKGAGIVRILTEGLVAGGFALGGGHIHQRRHHISVAVNLIQPGLAYAGMSLGGQ